MSVPTTLLIDGVDLSAYGFAIADAPDQRAGLHMDFPLATIPGVDGRLGLSLEGQSRERRISISGWARVSPGTTAHTTLLANLDNLKFRTLGRRAVEIVFQDVTTRYFTGRLESNSYPTIQPYQIARGIFVQWVFLCEDPLAYDTTDQSIDFTSGATQCPIGTARSKPIISAVGPATNLVVIYSNSGGTEIQRITTTGSIPAGETLEIDNATQRIALEGDLDDGAAFLQGDWGHFVTLDPKDAAALSGAYPTLQATGGPASIVAEYARAWE